MSANFIMGIDVGTQGVKGVLFSVDGQVCATAFRKSELYSPIPGTFEEDPERQLSNAIECARECVEISKIDAGQVAAVGIDGQMAGIIGVGRDGRNVTPYDSWLDTRCAPYIEKMERRAGDEILLKTGNAPGFNHGPKKLWWKYERPECFSKIATFVQPSAYVAMRLCGLNASHAFIDKTYLHFTGFVDNRKSRWDKNLTDAFDMPMEKLPEIVDPHKIVGGLLRTMADQCGLKEDTPVVAGCGDTVASFLACGATSSGVCVDVAGTASVFSLTSNEFKADIQHRTLGCAQAAVTGLWHFYAYINGGGLNLEWFKKEIAGEGLGFEELDQMVKNIGFEKDAPLFLPHLSGRACPSEPHRRGGWFGLGRNHGIAHLYRAILESVALEYAVYSEIAAELLPGLKQHEIRVTGGGEKSEAWNSLKSAVLGLPVTQIVSNSGAPMGAAMLAGYGAGLFNSLTEAAAVWVKKGRQFHPEEKGNEHYHFRLRKYKEMLACFKIIEN